MPEDENGLTVKIYNGWGQLMKTFDNVQKGENTITMEELPAGVYLFKLHLANGKVIPGRS